MTILSELSNEQIELLIRAYAKRELGKVEHVSHVMFFYRVGGEGKWDLAVRPDAKSYETTSTKGEILALCANEAVRRQQADQGNKLLLIEGAVVQG